MQTDERTDVTKLLVAFRNFATAPKNYTFSDLWFNFSQVFVTH